MLNRPIRLYIIYRTFNFRLYENRITRRQGMNEKKGVPIERFFEQSPDAISFFFDFAQVAHTGNEMVIQFYETIPGPPGVEGHIAKVRTRLRATITIGLAHAQTLGKLLTEKVEVKQ